MFYVCELTYPGTWLDYPDQEWARQVESLLRQLEATLADAAIALSLFERERQRSARAHNRAQWEADAKRRQEIETEIAAQRGIDRYSSDHWEELYLLADIAFKREKWQRGELPDSYEHRLPFLYAKSYLFAMDRLDRTAGVLGKQLEVPKSVADASDLLLELMPNLRGVRNSVAHNEDRSRGLKREGRPLELKPVENKLVSAPRGGVLILESLNDNRFGSTMADGHYGEVEVSRRVLDAACNIVQSIFNAYHWKGVAQHVPR